MTALTDLHFGLPAIAILLGVLFVIMLALCLKDRVKTGVRLWSFNFFLEASNDGTNKKSKWNPTTKRGN